MFKNLLYDPFQSAYRKQHSTETAILKVQNDIIASLDVGKCTVLGSLDLSAAFDTVDHHILLKRKRHLYGIDDTAWCWFESYLDNRHTKVSNQRFIILIPCISVWRTTGISIGCKIIFHVHLPNFEYHQTTWRSLSLLR